MDRHRSPQRLHVRGPTVRGRIAGAQRDYERLISGVKKGLRDVLGLGEAEGSK